MKKQIFMLLVLAVTLTRGIFAQQWERLTYEEMKADGTYGRTVTVEAAFVGWQQIKYLQDGNYLVSYISTLYAHKSEWNDWEFSTRLPIGSTLESRFWGFYRLYANNPKAGVKYHLNGLELIRIWDIPDGYALPLWWADDRKLFYSFHKMYLIKF